MKLLLDENLSHKLVQKLSDEFPGITHVSYVQLMSNSDLVIFRYAKENDFAIVTFDEDYFTLSVLNGSPPKIIWLRTGNISTKNVYDLLLSKKKLIEAFVEDKEIDAFGCLEIDG